MGNSLDKPVTEKKTVTGKSSSNHNGLLTFGISSMQGWRVSMEDEHIAESMEQIRIVLADGDEEEDGTIPRPRPTTNSCTTLQLDPPHYLFCILDGHGGSFAAEYSSQHLCRILCEQPSFITYAKLVGSELGLPEEEESTKKGKKKNRGKKEKDKATRKAKPSKEDVERLAGLLQRALEDAFVETDRQLLQELIKQGAYKLPYYNKEDARQKAELELELRLSEEGAGGGGGDDWAVDLVGPELDVLQPTPSFSESVSGTTATAVLVTPDFVMCANAGDSRAILDSFPLSTDHKPTLPHEQRRIEAADGRVFLGRVDGELAVSRALGDFEFKDYGQQRRLTSSSSSSIDDKRKVAQGLKVSPFPEVTVHYRSDADQMLVLACDGIWDVMSDQECHKLIQTLCREGESDMGLIAEEVLDTCLKKGSRDNMTIIVVQLPAQKIGQGGGVMKRRRQRPVKK
jgi:serine/threonine protein phosphatase PrpC